MWGIESNNGIDLLPVLPFMRTSAHRLLPGVTYYFLTLFSHQEFDKTASSIF
jgi:hypothetical protein